MCEVHASVTDAVTQAIVDLMRVRWELWDYLIGSCRDQSTH